ncbi:AMP dependent ligase [Paragonimus heterotremus]|uniref:AMP dependent ligase n=1 Tax=Paragonimus heterotremus TaxID=100268 RepID=A0A8J4SUF2_9TREM|nr:AMP dependent ligase [Paragonimus heterotremus]
MYATPQHIYAKQEPFRVMLTNGSRDPLLCRIFENNLWESTTLANKIAIWHVPDPRQIISTQTFPHNTQTNHNETERTECDENESCTVHSITFGELNTAATRLAEALADELIHCGAISGVQSKHDLRSAQTDAAQARTVIALFMPPGIKRIVAQIACMKLRLAYLPLDRQLSVGRIVQILDLISPAMVIMTKDYHDIIFSAQNEASARFHLIVNTSNLEPHSCSCFNDKLDTLKYALNRLKFSNYENLITTRLTNSGSTENKTDICLFENVDNPVITVLFTSGSTSSYPKIVRLRNNQLLNRLNWQWESNTELDEDHNWLTNRNRFAFAQNEVILASTACLFIDAFTELFSALFSGNPVVVPGGPNCTSEMCVSDVRILYKLIRMFQITRLTTVPIQLRIWIDQMGLIEPKDQCKEGDSLTTVVVSGDMLQPEMARQFFHLPVSESKVRLLNFYGTTEVAGDVTAAIFHDEQDVIKATKRVDTRNQVESLVDAAAFITVGRPIFNTAIYIVRKYEDKSCTQNDMISERSYNVPNLSVIGTQLYEVDWKSIGYEICDKGCVGEVAVTGLPVNWQATDVEEKSSESTFVSETNHLSSTSSQSSVVNFPGDLGFICPDDNMLYVCGRSDEVVKINAVGFLASDVDRILLRIKENCFRNPQHMSHLEKKLINIRDSVTLPIHHPASKSIQLVCFYVASSKRPSLKGGGTAVLLSSTSNAVGAEQHLLEDRMDFHLPLSIIHPQSIGWNDLDPKPNELSATIGHYLPVYIRPIFLRINHIPVMPTSGKVDKNRLRSLFNDTFVTERENYSPCKTSQLESTDELTQVTRPISSSTHTAGLLDYREQARKVLGSILGLQPTYVSEMLLPRPRDDEDFYLLGGNSLMAVLALESLRQLGFKVHLETFYLTSNIGQILDSLEPPRGLHYSQQDPVYSEKVNGVLNTVPDSSCSSMNTETQVCC